MGVGFPNLTVTHQRRFRTSVCNLGFPKLTFRCRGVSLDSLFTLNPYGLSLPTHMVVGRGKLAPTITDNFAQMSTCLSYHRLNRPIFPEIFGDFESHLLLLSVRPARKNSESRHLLDIWGSGMAEEAVPKHDIPRMGNKFARRFGRSVGEDFPSPTFNLFESCRQCGLDVPRNRCVSSDGSLGQ